MPFVINYDRHNENTTLEFENCVYFNVYKSVTFLKLRIIITVTNDKSKKDLTAVLPPKR